jgi:hypothetical protein
MHAPDYTHTTVGEIVGENIEISHALRSHHVDVAVSRKLTMAEVAQAVSTPTDELLAVMEYRLRRAARKS